MTHYVAYLDEFGHIGPYVSRSHKKHKTHPVFGFAGLILPATEIREFAISFYKVKCQLLAYDLVHHNPRNLPAYQWEKKGSQVYTLQNIKKYQDLRRSTFRLLNHIKKIGGLVFYTGVHKTTDPDTHNSSETFKQQLLQSLRKIDRFCAQSSSTFMLMLDEQRAGNEWRETNVEICTLAMFEDTAEKCRTLIEPPIQAESHLFQTIQCADWICGLIGRLTALSSAPDEYPELEPFDRYFSERINDVSMPGSGMDSHRFADIPVELAVQAMLDSVRVDAYEDSSATEKF